MSVPASCSPVVSELRCPCHVPDCGDDRVRPGSGALFLDRDGVINVDRGYTHRRQDFVFMPGIFDLARAAVGAGLAVVVVTNQAGIGRGLYGVDVLADLSRWMVRQFALANVPIARVYFCPHHPDATIAGLRRVCDCRKPAPGMLLAAARHLGLDLTRSVLIGDKATDLAAATTAGVPRRALLGDEPLPAELGAAIRGGSLDALTRQLF